MTGGLDLFTAAGCADLLDAPTARVAVCAVCGHGKPYRRGTCAPCLARGDEALSLTAGAGTIHTPAELVATHQDDWPDKCDDPSGLAVARGVLVGRIWRDGSRTWSATTFTPQGGSFGTGYGSRTRALLALRDAHCVAIYQHDGLVFVAR